VAVAVRGKISRNKPIGVKQVKKQKYIQFVSQLVLNIGSVPLISFWVNDEFWTKTFIPSSLLPL
jgi:hypothetical protein